MTGLKVPIISIVIGEGGSGGALAIGVCDRLLMLSYATYSVISPEGCASILWKSADKAPEAAEAMKVTSKQLMEFELIDRIIEEPLGGAHRDPGATIRTTRQAIQEELERLLKLDEKSLLMQREEKIGKMGRFVEA